MLGEYLPYVIIVVVASALIAATVVLARLAWRRQVRRYLVALMGRREDIAAALKTVDGVVGALASGSVEDVISFARPDSEERRVVADVASRMRIGADELADLPLPKKLWALADQLGAAAASLALAAAGVGEAEGDAVLDALVALDLTPVRAVLDESAAESARLAELYDLTDAAVYGGGLYI